MPLTIPLSWQLALCRVAMVFCLDSAKGREGSKLKIERRKEVCWLVDGKELWRKEKGRGYGAFKEGKDNSGGEEN